MYMLHVTVGQVVGLDIFQEGHPELLSQPVAGAQDELVRWMHILETERPEGLLPGGEFVLTTATFLDRAAGGVQGGVAAANRFLDTIEQTGAVAVAAEILPGREHIANILATAARHRPFPIYLLPGRIRFVELTQTIHENIAAARFQEIETDRQIHETFTRLSVGSASTDRIVTEATTLLGCQVKWETAEAKSDTVVVAEHPVVAGDETLGRLIIVEGCQADASLVTTVLERAAQALSISVLAKRSQDEIRRSTASSLFYQLRGGTDLSEEEVLWRLTETSGRHVLSEVKWFPMVVRILGEDAGEELLNRWSGMLLDVLDSVGDSQKVSVFAARSEIGVVDVLLPLADPAALSGFVEATRARFTARLRGRGGLVAGLASDAPSAKAAVEQLSNAAQIAQAAQAYVKATGQSRAYFFAKDLGLRGLLATLRDDDQLVAFVATELAGLSNSTGSRQSFESRLDFLEAVLTSHNKAQLARSRHMSRPALYSQIKRLETVLGYSLEDDAEQNTALHLAVMAYRMNPNTMYGVLHSRSTAG